MARAPKIDDPRMNGRYDAAVNQVGAASAQGYAPTDDLEYDDSRTGVSLQSMKKAKRYMWISIGFMIICIALVAGYIFLYNSSITSAQRACWLEQQNIELLANKYVVDNGFSSLPAYVEDIPAFEQIYADCPSGGEYTWNPILGEYSCSEHGHYPPQFNQAQSIISGQQTHVVTDQ